MSDLLVMPEITKNADGFTQVKRILGVFTLFKNGSVMWGKAESGQNCAGVKIVALEHGVNHKGVEVRASARFTRPPQPLWFTQLHREKVATCLRRHLEHLNRAQGGEGLIHPKRGVPTG